MARIRGVIVAAAVLVFAAPAAAAPEPEPYRTNDFGGFWNVLPPGENGLVTGPQAAGFLTLGQRPPHSSDQLARYGDLVYASPGLQRGDLERYFNDASFGTKPGEEERRYSPRDDVTIVRDSAVGVPHVYGSTRAGVMFGAGYVAAEDRLFFIDVLRHLGRAQLSSFVGGSRSNRQLDQEQWEVAPYNEEDFTRQAEQMDDLYGAAGAQVQEDVGHYIDGINQYIREARASPLTKMPAEYAAVNRPQGPDDWRVNDIIATASLIGGIFGRGGGGELDSAVLLQEFRARFGARRGRRIWSDFRSAEDPEAPTTVHRTRFPYQRPPRRVKRRSRAMPDRGSVLRHEVSSQGSGGGGGGSQQQGGGPLDAVLDFPATASNALLVSARESESGRALAVFGPQAAYFAPQILMDIDLHGPTVDARGAAFPGINLYVQLGRGRDYAWSATSAGQDNTGTFALDLCDPNGGRATMESMHYEFRGQCLPIEVLERRNSWTPNAADQTPAGSETLRAERTRLGLVAARATIRNRPVIYTRLRSTYFHEVDSAPAFAKFNDPGAIRNAGDFQRAAHEVGYTFNWFYADDRDIAYYNSGNNPVAARRTDPNLPVWGRYEWRGWDPARFTARYTAFERHPQVVNQPFLTSWNNKQARGYRAADDNYSFTSVHRSQPLDDRIRRGIRGGEKMSLVELIDAMEDAATVDLRGDKVLRWGLRMLGNQSDPALRTAIERLDAWRRDGAHRRDRDRDGVYEHAEAIRIMDAWWPLLVEAQFKPVLGQQIYDRVRAIMPLDNAPNNNGAHLGSAYQYGWYGYVAKDLRRILGRRVRGRYSLRYCGAGRRRSCREALADSLRRALPLAGDPQELYEDPLCDSGQNQSLDDQWCFDAIRHTPLGAVTQPLIHWVNRPTFQQAVEIEGHRPR